MSTVDRNQVAATDARQGWRSGRVIWVLVISVLLAAVALALVWAGYLGHFAKDQPATTTPTGASQFHTPKSPTSAQAPNDQAAFTLRLG
jgi:hypothetical protein